MYLLTLASRSSWPINGNGRRRAIAKNMYLHPVLRDILCWVTVSEPEEPKKITMILSNLDTIKYLLDVSCDGYGFLVESNDSQQVIVQIRAC